jgi:hypothetical protein
MGQLATFTETLALDLSSEHWDKDRRFEPMHLHLLLLYTWKLERKMHYCILFYFCADEDKDNILKVKFILRIHVANCRRILHYGACLHVHDTLPGYRGIFPL